MRRSIIVAKYDPLFEYLSRAGDVPVELGFEEISQLVGGLHASAERHGAWWSNELYGRHVQARAWLNGRATSRRSRSPEPHRDLLRTEVDARRMSVEDPAGSDGDEGPKRRGYSDAVESGGAKGRSGVPAGT